MNNYKNITQPTIERRKEVDSLSKENQTWEEKMIYAISHSEIIDENYFESDSGELFVLGDKRLKCLIKETSEGETPIVYRSTKIKASEIGTLYDLVEDKMSINGHIVIKSK